MRLLLDEHYSREIALRLRAAGRDATAVTDTGIAGMGDEELLRHAASERRALLTNNVRHFVPLARDWAAARQDHYGLLFTSDSGLPRGKKTIGLYVNLLGTLMDAHREDHAFMNRIHWLP